MSRILLAMSFFWCFSAMTAFAHFPTKEELNYLCQLSNQDEAGHILWERLQHESYEENLQLIRWFTSPMDERPFSFPSFILIASGSLRLTHLLINTMMGIVYQPTWFPLLSSLRHTLINTDLFYSVSTGDLSRVLSLLHYNPEHIRIVDHNHHSLLSYAVRYGHDDIIRNLWESMMAVGIWEEMRMRMIRVPYFPDVDGNSLMHLAVHYNQISSMRVLLSLNYPINSSNHQGQTPLTLSINEGRELTTVFLLHQGANPNIADHSGRRPLEIAMARGQVNDIISLIGHQLLSIESTLGRSLDTLTAENEPETFAVSYLIAHNDMTNSFTSHIDYQSLINNPRRQELLKLCQCLRKFAEGMTLLLQRSQIMQQSLSHNLQLSGPEHQQQLLEEHLQLESSRERLMEVYHHLQNSLQDIRQDVGGSQQE